MQKVVSKEVWRSDEELFWTTYLTFDKMRQYCKDRKSYDAWKMMNIYLFYARCSSIQEMKKVYATNKFVSEWTWYSEDTITKYTKAMQEIWCIERILKYDEQWKFIWHFIKISFCMKSDDNLTVPDMDWNLLRKETPTNTDDIKYENTYDIKELNTSFEKEILNPSKNTLGIINPPIADTPRKEKELVIKPEKIIENLKSEWRLAYKFPNIDEQWLKIEILSMFDWAKSKKREIKVRKTFIDNWYTDKTTNTRKYYKKLEVKKSIEIDYFAVRQDYK